MKKTALTFGLISGAVAIAMMLMTLPFISSHRSGTADVLGYTSILLSALLVFFGIRSYREHHAENGQLTFGRGLAVGLLITLISTTCYAAAFEIIYFKLAPDFGDQFSACMVERVRASGGSQKEIVETVKRAATLKRLYDHPATNAALTFATTLPVGLAVTAISAGILRRKSGG